ncbi:glutathione S-transferase family protein [Roseovarius sp. M141]|uniref:glutathione S-transferase family protein n=1 Tax=Roseovarius sp. M141 TaxID=2583806 RepID=UPI0020CDBEEA|nr:glutathione S-transferase N-terminal domain-containing protein [Roseovarius sp. M141]MCQ0090808.1 glutathione S-transferase [Roseovarius sp. M141]
MTTLFYAPGACSLAPHIVLEWIGAPYESVKVGFGSKELLAVNPAGSVPTLREEDGWLLNQCGAILDYLAGKHPEAGLSGGDSLREKAEAHRWSAFFTSDMHAAFWPIFLPQRYTTDAGDEAKQAVIEAGHALVRKQLGLLDAHLNGQKWILGQRSVIDAYAFPMIRWAIRMVPNGLAGHANVQALHDRLAADKDVQKILDREAS